MDFLNRKPEETGSLKGGAVNLSVKFPHVKTPSCLTLRPQLLRCLEVLKGRKPSHLATDVENMSHCKHVQFMQQLSRTCFLPGVCKHVFHSCSWLAFQLGKGRVKNSHGQGNLLASSTNSYSLHTVISSLACYTQMFLCYTRRLVLSVAGTK